jgi:hypothetical protein
MTARTFPGRQAYPSPHRKSGRAWIRARGRRFKSCQPDRIGHVHAGGRGFFMPEVAPDATQPGAAHILPTCPGADPGAIALPRAKQHDDKAIAAINLRA